MDRMLRVILLIMLISMLLIVGCSGESEQDISGLGRITGCSAGSASSIQLGEPAPDFQFQTAEGQATSLSDLRGKAVLVNFWATWCGYCRMEIPYIQQVYDEWQGKGFVLLTIDLGESSDTVAEFMQGQGLSFPVLLDSEGKVAQRYGIRGIPATFFIDKDGIIQDMKVGAFQSKEEIESSLSKLGITK